MAVADVSIAIVIFFELARTMGTTVRARFVQAWPLHGGLRSPVLSPKKNSLPGATFSFSTSITLPFRLPSIFSCLLNRKTCAWALLVPSNQGEACEEVLIMGIHDTALFDVVVLGR